MAVQPPPVRRRDAERNRALIVGAATRILRGDPEASIADVAAAADLSRATVYGHFATREALVCAVVEQSMGRLADLGREAGLADGPPAVSFARFVLAAWAFGEHHPNLRVASQRAPTGADAFEHHFAAVQRLLHACVRRGQAVGDFRDDLDATFLETCLHGMMPAMLEAHADGRLSVRRPDRATALAALGILGMGPADAREILAAAERAPVCA